MSKTQKIYRRTAAGQKAWDSKDAAVPAKYMKILGALEADSDFRLLRHKIPLYPDHLLVEGLDVLEELHLIEPLPDMTETDLDFTGSFNISDFTGQKRS
jgi:hypothetical protein